MSHHTVFHLPTTSLVQNARTNPNPRAVPTMTGIGDTTEPLPAPVAKAMSDYCLALGTAEGYSGYDPPIEADVKELVAKVCSQRSNPLAGRFAVLL